jgi:hypothetical protein
MVEAATGINFSGCNVALAKIFNLWLNNKKSHKKGAFGVIEVWWCSLPWHRKDKQRVNA